MLLLLLLLLCLLLCSRCQSREKGERQLQQLLDAGVSTFISLQVGGEVARVQGFRVLGCRV